MISRGGHRPPDGLPPPPALDGRASRRAERSSVVPVLIPGFNPGVFTGDGNNTWLLPGREPVLIDAATGGERHLGRLREALGPAPLARVLVTHGHPDHASGAPALAAAWPGAAFAKMPDAGDGRYPVAWQPLAEGDLVPAGGGALRVLHTPGHAPDHVCLLDEAADTLYCGDLLVSGGSVVIPASAGGSLADYLASLARVRALRPARVLPGHGPEIRDVVRLIDHYVAHRVPPRRAGPRGARGGRGDARSRGEQGLPRPREEPAARGRRKRPRPPGEAGGGGPRAATAGRGRRVGGGLRKPWRPRAGPPFVA